MEEFAAVPLVALAAWQALADLARVKAGQKVLVHAGAGGLGSTVIQIAKHLGAHVATTAHGDSRGEGARPWRERSHRLHEGRLRRVALRLYDVVLDSLGGDNLAKSLTRAQDLAAWPISVVGPPDTAFAEQVGRPILKPVMVLMSRKVRAQARKNLWALRYSFFVERRWRAAEGAGRSMMRARCVRYSTARSHSTRRWMRSHM